MPDSLLLRRLGYDHPDAVALTEVAQDHYVRLYGGSDDNPVCPADFAAPNGSFLIGYSAEGAVAMGGWRFFARPSPIPAERPAEIRRMFVREDVRGRGYARALLAALEYSAVEAGADAIILETGTPQVDAIGLYRSAGYVDVPRFGHYADSDLAVHLGKILSGGCS